MSPTWFDTHCHLHDESSPYEVVKDAVENRVTRMVVVGTDLTSSVRVCEIVSDIRTKALKDQINLDGIWAAVGVHPHEAKGGIGELPGFVRKTTSDETGLIVAIGECGLDYYYEHSPKNAQKDVFSSQIRLAQESGLALVIHTRDAWEDTFATLDYEGIPEKTVIHCFTGGVDELLECEKRGIYVSFSGIASFPKASELHKAVKVAKDKRFLIETDSPYLAPVPFRGKPNFPKYVASVGLAVANLRGVSEDDLAHVATMAAIDFFDVN
ncbi:MAG: TatD family hydrolase [Acidimicrobiales bacterium]|nr:TatD family hydrolase [Acidimicrobiales bacterium]